MWEEPEVSQTVGGTETGRGTSQVKEVTPSLSENACG